MFLFVIFLLLQQLPGHCYKYWEDYSEIEKESVLHTSIIPSRIKDYICETPTLFTDNEETQFILESLSSLTNDEDIHALYFHLFNQWFYQSDGALSEMISPYCLRIVYANPDYALSYFERFPEIMRWYADSIGVEFALAENEDCYFRFRNVILLSKTGMKVRGLFLDLIEERIRAINQ